MSPTADPVGSERSGSTQGSPSRLREVDRHSVGECRERHRDLQTEHRRKVLLHVIRLGHEHLEAHVHEPEVAKQVEDLCLAVYERALKHGEAAGIIIADTDVCLSSCRRSGSN